MIGDYFSCRTGLRIEAIKSYNKEKFLPSIKIGDKVHLEKNVHIATNTNIIIRNNVLIASNVYISNLNHGIYKGDIQSKPTIPPFLRNLSLDKDIIIEDNVWIGQNVSIVAGAKIGTSAIVSANSVVTKDVPSYCIVAGIPAKVIKKYNFETEKWENKSK